MLGLWLYIALLDDIGLIQVVSQLCVPCTAPKEVANSFPAIFCFLETVGGGGTMLRTELIGISTNKKKPSHLCGQDTDLCAEP